MTSKIDAVAARRGQEPIAFTLHRGRSRKSIVRIIPDGDLYRIEWPDIGLSDFCNLSRAKAAALEWAQHNETKLPAAQRRPLRWSR
jgi:hypothetical protein